MSDMSKWADEARWATVGESPSPFLSVLAEERSHSAQSLPRVSPELLDDLFSREQLDGLGDEPAPLAA